MLSIFMCALFGVTVVFADNNTSLSFLLDRSLTDEYLGTQVFSQANKNNTFYAKMEIETDVGFLLLIYTIM